MLTALPVDHIGIAVRDLDSSIHFYVSQFGHSLTHRETLAEDALEVAFLENGASTIELIAPTSNTGSVFRFLESRGPGMHHICFRTSDIKEELRRLADGGLRLIDTVARKGSRGKLIAFIHPASCGGVLIELCQKP